MNKPSRKAIVTLSVGFGFLFLLSVLVTVKSQAPAPVAMVPTPIPAGGFQQARDMSDAVANDLVQDDMKDLYPKLDVGFRMVISGEKDLKTEVDKMVKIYGHLKEWRFKIAKTGTRVDGAWRRSSRTFFYAVKTTKYPFGKYFLKIEIVPNYNTAGDIDVSGFGFFTYDNGAIPEYLK